METSFCCSQKKIYKSLNVTSELKMSFFSSLLWY